MSGWIISQRAIQMAEAKMAETRSNDETTYDLVEAIADPNHKQHQELKLWLGDDFDPIDFSIDSVNQMLLPARRRAKTAKE